jgi:hypothetical protein
MTVLHAKTAALAGIAGTNLMAMVTTEHISSAFQFGTMLGIVLLAFMQRMDARKALALAIATKATTDQTRDTTDKIHVLSNSAMEAQLRIVWLQAKRIADMTKKKADRDVATEAEKLYNEHVLKQKAVDAQKSSAL